MLNKERSCLEKEKLQLISELENNSRQIDEHLNRHKATIEANAAAKLESTIKESVARARLEWLKEKSGDVEDLVHVEKSLGNPLFKSGLFFFLFYVRLSRTIGFLLLLRFVSFLGELQCLRESMDALRHERDNLQKELIQCDQQLRMEKHLLHEKFQREKETLNKNWEAKLSAVSEKVEQNQNNSLMAITANTMARLKQQFEEEKLLIINNYEKQIMELQSTPSTPIASSNLIGCDWKIEISRLKMTLRSTKGIPADILLGVESALQKAEIAWQQDQNAIQFHSEKYKTLKRRVRDYKKSIASEMKKCKEERQRSEDYCLRFISEVLSKVTSSFQLHQMRYDTLPLPTTSTNKPAAVSRVHTARSAEGTTYAQSMDEIRSQVNRLVEELTAFPK